LPTFSNNSLPVLGLICVVFCGVVSVCLQAVNANKKIIKYSALFMMKKLKLMTSLDGNGILFLRFKNYHLKRLLRASQKKIQ
jgi:hypothetical protein